MKFWQLLYTRKFILKLKEKLNSLSSHAPHRRPLSLTFDDDHGNRPIGSHYALNGDKSSRLSLTPTSSVQPYNSRRSRRTLSPASTKTMTSSYGTHNQVDEDGNAVMQGLDSSKLVPLLTAALQESIAKIESLEERLTNAGL